MPEKKTKSRSRKKKAYVEVAAALIRNENDGRFLITQRYLDDFMGGLWEFPGGKRRKNETLRGCLKREVKEEVGIEIEVGARYQSVKYDYPDRSVALSFYWARLERGKPKTLGCRALKWVQPRQLLDYSFPPADAELILRLSRPETLFNNREH